MIIRSIGWLSSWNCGQERDRRTDRNIMCRGLSPLCDGVLLRPLATHLSSKKSSPGNNAAVMKSRWFDDGVSLDFEIEVMVDDG